MNLDSTHIKILKDIKSFTKVKKYRGMLPSKLALFNQDRKFDELLEAGLVQRLYVTTACGSESLYFKLTDNGHGFLDSLSPEELCADECPREYGDEEDDYLTTDQASILNDIYHYSKITKHGGIMPTELLGEFDSRIINALFSKGCLIRVKADMGRSRKRKGLMLSEKGLRLLLFFTHDREPAS
ncbi:MAG: hypothetical protein H0S85_11785 [Desulfovibrionaceae bacterium]|jgi:hypothetical protein|nr:hypothetical protein [Desulfovibrionaceae bacterium]